MSNIEITKREILVGIVIGLIMITLGFFLATSIHNSVSESNEKYFKALKVDNNPDMFNYAINTEIGDMVSYGKFKASEPVSDDMIDGKYFSIRKIEQHYVMKTRTVTYTDSNGKTKTRTETYWEWDEVNREYFNTKTFEYLGETFDHDFISIDHYEYKDTIKVSSHVRYKIYTIPSEFNAALYSKAVDKTIKDNQIYPHDTIETLVDKKEKSADTSVIIFWIAWVLMTIGAIIGFVALDNKYLNDK